MPPGLSIAPCDVCIHSVTSNWTQLIKPFGSVSYSRPTVESAKSIIKNDSTISTWDPRIISEFMIVIGSTYKVGISKFTVSTKFCYKILERLVGNTLKAAQKTMASSSPTYFMCSIFMKALYKLSPNSDFDWSINLQPYSIQGHLLIFWQQ